MSQVSEQETRTFITYVGLTITFLYELQFHEFNMNSNLQRPR